MCPRLGDAITGWFLQLPLWEKEKRRKGQREMNLTHTLGRLTQQSFVLSQLGDLDAGGRQPLGSSFPVTGTSVQPGLSSEGIYCFYATDKLRDEPLPSGAQMMLPDYLHLLASLPPAESRSDPPSWRGQMVFPSD